MPAAEGGDMSSVVEEATCFRWSRDFVVAHAIFAAGLVTAPVAVIHLVRRPHSRRALFFAILAIFCAAISLVLCCRFYAELKRPPWPRWLSAPFARGGGHRRQQQQDAGDRVRESTRDDEEVSHDLRQPEIPVMFRVEMQAALASGRVASYEHRGGAADCAVCLDDVEKGEVVRRLPACHHVFHRECIDLWLRAHATCPVCRRGVLSPLPEVLVTVDAAGNGPPSPE